MSAHGGKNEPVLLPHPTHAQPQPRLGCAMPAGCVEVSVTSEAKVKMAAQLYDMRDKAKRLLGDKYKGHMELLGKVLKDIAYRRKQEVLSVAIEHCKNRELTGIEFLLTMAAAVEIMEPSK